MRCPSCQHDNPPDGHFCGQCGSPLAATCSECGAANPPGNKFCGQCGTRLSLTPQAEQTHRTASLESHTPKHLAQRILTSRSALEGERKQVTILFADLKGSLEMLADRDPEEAHELLDPVVERMMNAVHRYEGTVSEVRGDGIMALFGAPLAHEDHAMRACYAALDMQSAVKRYADEVRRSHGVKAQIRVGINSGEVVVRAIGSDLRMDYSAVGESTHLAGRMEQLADPGSTLLTGDTLRLAEGYIDVEPLGPVPVKGIEAPVDVYALTGARSVRSRLQAAAARGLTRFVGREKELEQIRQALAKTAEGHGQVVASVGEAGVGKSRLAWEVTHSHRTDGWTIAQSSSVSYGKATAFLPVVDLLKGYFQIEGQDDARKSREMVTGKLLTLDRALEPTLPALLWLLDVPVEDPTWQALDPRQRRLQTLDGVKRLLLRESQVQPLLVIFEDLHWIDSETQALLDTLVESIPTARMLLHVNYRPEYEHHWGGKTYYTQIRLDPLPEESAEELLDALLGSDSSLGPLKQLLVERTQGNPFFLEESVQTLVETKDLVGERGAYRLARPTESLQMPATVQTVLAARIDRLPGEEKELLEMAAVIGKVVPLALLETLYDKDESLLREGLAHLQVMEFIYEASLFPEVEFTFKHALTHEVAYGTLLSEQRRSLHARIVDAIEKVYGSRMVEQIERLAHHAFRGEQWDRAVSFLHQAGEKAAARSGYPQAVDYLDQALVALDHLSESEETLQQGIDLRFDLRSALQALGDHERVFEHLRDAERLASNLGDRDRLGWASAYFTQYLWRTGDARRAEEQGQRALAIASELDDFALEVVANFFLGQGLFNIGDYRRAIDHCQRNVEILTGERAHERLGLTGLPSVLSRTWLAWSLAERGEFANAIEHAKDALSVAEAAGQVYSIATANLCLGHVLVTRGEHAEALPALAHATELCRNFDLGVIYPTAAAVLGLAHAMAGDVNEALSIVTESEDQAPEVRIFDTPAARTALGSVCYLAGHLDRAAEFGSRVLEWAVDGGFQGTRARAHQLLGDVHAARDPTDIDQAEEHYRQALALAEELGMKPVTAHCQLGLGRVLQCAGRPKPARELLATAAETYAGMKMVLYAEQAEAALKELN